MTIELTKEELKLILICVEDKSSSLLANCFNSKVNQDTKFLARCKELHTQCNELEKKLLAIYKDEE